MEIWLREHLRTVKPLTPTLHRFDEFICGHKQARSNFTNMHRQKSKRIDVFSKVSRCSELQPQFATYIYVYINMVNNNNLFTQTRSISAFTT
ncbi:hypothetical protein Hanom_Chr15g01383641 [Helianthus anomalus]